MTKAKSSDVSKINSVVAEFPSEIARSDDGELFCTLCACVVKHDRRHFINSHRQTFIHQRFFSRNEPRQSTIVQSLEAATVKDNVTNAFLSANIPLEKLQNPQLKQLFSKIGHPFPSESTARRQVDTIFEEQQQRIKQKLQFLCPLTKAK